MVQCEKLRKFIHTLCYICIYICVCAYVSIYCIYGDRETDGQRETDRKRSRYKYTNVYILERMEKY